MNMFLISIKGKFNILVKISDLQNFNSYRSKSFLVYEILPFYKVIVVDNLNVSLKVFSKKPSTFTCVDTTECTDQIGRNFKTTFLYYQKTFRKCKDSFGIDLICCGFVSFLGSSVDKVDIDR